MRNRFNHQNLAQDSVEIYDLLLTDKVWFRSVNTIQAFSTIYPLKLDVIFQRDQILGEAILL